MGQYMENGGRKTDRSADPYAHVDITDLRDGRISDHLADILLSYRKHGTDDYSSNTEDIKDVEYLRCPYDLDTDDPVIDLDQQEDISLRYNRAQQRARAGI